VVAWLFTISSDLKGENMIRPHQFNSFYYLLPILCLAFLITSTAFADYLFSPSIALNTNAATDSGFDYEVEVASGGHGVWIAVWKTDDDLDGTIGEDFDIVYSISTNYGRTWSPLAPLHSNATTDSGDDISPSIAADGQGNWLVVWESFEKLDPDDHHNSTDIFYCYSNDDGLTWSEPDYLSLVQPTGPKNESPVVATDGADTWLAAWHSTDNLNNTIGGDEDILLCHSLNGGKNWSQPAAMNMNSATDVARDMFVHLATDKKGTWMAVWAQRGGENGSDDDIAISRSTVNGAGWSWPSLVNASPAEDSGHDSHPRVATDGNGHWVAVWESYDTLGGILGTDADILSARSLNNGETWYGWSTVNSSARSDNGARFADNHPTIASDGRNTWLVCWESNNWLDGLVGTDRDILAAKSLDYGVSWTELEPLNVTAEEDSEADNWPVLVCDGFNAWGTAWVSRDKLGGMIGSDSDRDIFFSFGIFTSVADEQSLAAYLESWGKGAGDLNDDGKIDYEDIFLLSHQWQEE
jgi:hypothetical protein